MSDKIELKACPFCGGTELSVEPWSVQPDNYHAARVACADCEIEGPSSLTLPDPDGCWMPDKDSAIVKGIKAWNRRAAIAQRPAPAAQEPVAIKLGIYGAAFDGPSTKRAYTYSHQPGSVQAMKLGRAVRGAFEAYAGDDIDRGLGLLKSLQDEGFGVFNVGAEFAAPAAPAQVAQGAAMRDYPHDEMDALATSRYRVGASDTGVLHRFSVRAGDAQQELYRGSKSDCESVSRKLAGAFLDGGLSAYDMLAASPAAPVAVQEPYDSHAELHEEIGGLKSVNFMLCQALKSLTLHARTAGGTAGADDDLMQACEKAEHALSLGGIGKSYMEGANAVSEQAQQPDMIHCSCGDSYPSTSYGAGFIDGSGMCTNCDAALPARDIPARPAEQPDSVNVRRELLRRAMRDCMFLSTDETVRCNAERNSAIKELRTLLTGGDA